MSCKSLCGAKAKSLLCVRVQLCSSSSSECVPLVSPGDGGGGGCGEWVRTAVLLVRQGGDAKRERS